MTKRKFLDSAIVVRYEKNPILTAKDIPVPCNSVFNPGAVKFKDKYLLLLRVEDYDRLSHFRVATSDDGIHFQVSKDPLILPQEEHHKRYELNIYDARITYLEGWYYICACCQSHIGCRNGLWRTKDFVTVQRIGYTSHVDFRNSVLFPEKINGLYTMLDRPFNSHNRGNMWVSYSPDLIFWGKADLVLETRFHYWDELKLGPSCVPIKTPEGWLVIYHGVQENCSCSRYVQAVCLLDLKDPSKVLARSNRAFLVPQEPYERVGDVPNVVFCNGAIVEDDGTVKIYYGGADTVVCLATTTVEKLIYFAKYC